MIQRVARRRSRMRVSLVPLIDVLFILLVYFMVTSVYRDLDMIPMVGTRDLSAPDAATGSATGSGARGLLRIAPDGTVLARGRPIGPDAMPDLVAGRPVTILPSPRASVQHLARLLGDLAAAGAGPVGVMRLEPRE